MIPSFSPSARSILSFLNGVCFVHPKLPLFSRPPTFFFKDSYILIKYPFIHVKSLHSFQSMFLPGGSHEDVLQVYHSSFLFSSGGLNSSFVDHILSLFQMFSHAGAPLNHQLLAIHLFWSTEDISEESCFHSQSVQDISRLLSHSSHLIQPVQFPFQVIFRRCIF